jgi:murein DD-endopeptidase MepM/ murein hydrolase activator NlpD
MTNMRNLQIPTRPRAPAGLTPKKKSKGLVSALILALTGLAIAGGYAISQSGQTQSTTTTPQQTTQQTTIPTTRQQLYKLYGKLFFDHSGNGIQDPGEPDMPNVVIALNGKNVTSTNSTGWYLIGDLERGNYTIRPFPPKNFRYMCESAAEFRSVKESYRVSVGNDTRKDIGIMEGYLTLPFVKGTVERGPRVYVDVGNCRDWKGGSDTYNGHLGTDFFLSIGIKILAAAPGQVVYSYWHEDDGHVIGIRHLDGKLTLYAHLSERMVNLKQNVTRGQVIGLSGHTGRLSGRDPHLHFQFGGYGRNRIDPYRDLLNPLSVGYWTVDNNPQYPF